MRLSAYENHSVFSIQAMFLQGGAGGFGEEDLYSSQLKNFMGFYFVDRLPKQAGVGLSSARSGEMGVALARNLDRITRYKISAMKQIAA